MTKRLLTRSVAADPGAVKHEELPETVQRLLTAGTEAFAEQGFHGTTTREIAQRAGLSPAGLYVHYPSKAALLGHLTELGHAAALDLVASSLGPDDGTSPAVRLHRTVDAFVRWHAEHHLEARVVQHELGSLDDDVRRRVSAARRELEARVEHVVRLGAADGSLDVEHPRQATRAVLSLAVDVARWFDPAGRETSEELAAVYADLALRMLGRSSDPTPKGLPRR